MTEQFPQPEKVPSNIHEKLTSRKIREGIFTRRKEELIKAFQGVMSSKELEHFTREYAISNPVKLSENQKTEIISGWNAYWRKELGEGVLEELMQRVINIDTPGTAYTVINPEEIKGVLQKGVIKHGLKNKSDVEIVKTNQLKARLKEPVFFNIVGKGSDTIKNSFWVSNPNVSGMGAYGKNFGLVERMILLFDLSRFKEDTPQHRLKTTLKNRFFARDIAGGHREDITEFGFFTNSRIQPRFFTGMVLKPYQDRDSLTDVFFEQDLEKIISIMCCFNHVLPIYDVEGFLLWPKKMTRSEVLNIVQGNKQDN